MWKEATIVFCITVFGLSWAYFQLTTGNQVTPIDVVFSIFVEVFGIGITILGLDKLWHYEENKRWKLVEDDVKKLLSDEITNIFRDFASIMIPPKVIVVEKTPDEIDEIERKTNEHQLSELTRLATAEVDVIANRLIEEKHLFEGDYGELFEKRYENLSDIERKYGKFLEPPILRLIIRLERLLKSLSGNIKVRLKWKTESKEHWLVGSAEGKIVFRVHDIMKTLDGFKDVGLLELG